jgi:hypothetical protein
MYEMRVRTKPLVRRTQWCGGFLQTAQSELIRRSTSYRHRSFSRRITPN